MKSKVIVSICGQDYVIAAEESEDYIRQVGHQVDRKMRDLMEQNPKLSMAQAAVLAAVNIHDEGLKSQKSSDHLRSQMKQYLDDTAKARQEAEEAKREVLRLRNELQEMKIQLVKKETQGGLRS